MKGGLEWWKLALVCLTTTINLEWQQCGHSCSWMGDPLIRQLQYILHGAALGDGLDSAVSAICSSYTAEGITFYIRHDTNSERIALAVNMVRVQLQGVSDDFQSPKQLAS